MKKNIFGVLISCLMLTAFSASAAVDAGNAKAFVEKVTQEGLVDIINSNVSQQEKDRRFEKLFNEALDLKFIGQFVLGRYWRTATPEQKKEFIEVYRQLNVKTWSQRFDEFRGKKFIFNGTSPSSSANPLCVNSSVPMDQGNPASVVWRVKQSGNSFKIVDIIIENVSLAITARNEYTAFIKKSPNGIDGLIKDLKAKVRQN